MVNEEPRMRPGKKSKLEKMHQIGMIRDSIFEPMKRERGSMKFIILMMLQEQPMHGYALMKAIEDKYEYPASQGIIYPTLQMLEDQGYVEITEQDHKKVYSVTKEGKQYLQENSDIIERIKSRMEEPQWKSMPITRKRFHDLAWLIFSNYKYLDDDKMKQIEDILEDTRKRIGKIIFEE